MIFPIPGASLSRGNDDDDDDDDACLSKTRRMNRRKLAPPHETGRTGDGLYSGNQTAVNGKMAAKKGS